MIPFPPDILIFILYWELQHYSESIIYHLCTIILLYLHMYILWHLYITIIVEQKYFVLFFEEDDIKSIISKRIYFLLCTFFQKLNLNVLRYSGKHMYSNSKMNLSSFYHFFQIDSVDLRILFCFLFILKITSLFFLFQSVYYCLNFFFFFFCKQYLWTGYCVCVCVCEYIYIYITLISSTFFYVIKNIDIEYIWN